MRKRGTRYGHACTVTAAKLTTQLLHDIEVLNKSDIFNGSNSILRAKEVQVCRSMAINRLCYRFVAPSQTQWSPTQTPQLPLTVGPILAEGKEGQFGEQEPWGRLKTNRLQVKTASQLLCTVFWSNAQKITKNAELSRRLCRVGIGVRFSQISWLHACWLWCWIPRWQLGLKFPSGVKGIKELRRSEISFNSADIKSSNPLLVSEMTWRSRREPHF